MRIDRHEMFMKIARLVAQRSTCTRGHVGALLVHDRRIISMGYNGAPPGLPHCLDEGCQFLMREVEEPIGVWTPQPDREAGCQRAIHAELNAIAWAARAGVRTVGTFLYCTHGPCLRCAQAIISAGIMGVMFEHPYRLPDGVKLLEKTGIEIWPCSS